VEPGRSSRVLRDRHPCGRPALRGSGGPAAVLGRGAEDARPDPGLQLVGAYPPGIPGGLSPSRLALRPPAAALGLSAAESGVGGAGGLPGLVALAAAAVVLRVRPDGLDRARLLRRVPLAHRGLLDAGAGGPGARRVVLAGGGGG